MIRKYQPSPCHMRFYRSTVIISLCRSSHFRVRPLPLLPLCLEHARTVSDSGFPVIDGFECWQNLNFVLVVYDLHFRFVSFQWMEFKSWVQNVKFALNWNSALIYDLQEAFLQELLHGFHRNFFRGGEIPPMDPGFLPEILSKVPLGIRSEILPGIAPRILRELSSDIRSGTWNDSFRDFSESFGNPLAIVVEIPSLIPSKFPFKTPSKISSKNLSLVSFEMSSVFF